MNLKLFVFIVCKIHAFKNYLFVKYRAARIVAALQPGCEEMARECRNEEEMERK